MAKYAIGYNQWYPKAHADRIVNARIKAVALLKNDRRRYISIYDGKKLIGIVAFNGGYIWEYMDTVKETTHRLNERTGTIGRKW